MSKNGSPIARGVSALRIRTNKDTGACATAKSAAAGICYRERQAALIRDNATDGPTLERLVTQEPTVRSR